MMFRQRKTPEMVICVLLKPSAFTWHTLNVIIIFRQ